MNHLTDDLINKYLDDDVEVSEINFINKHLDECISCKESYESLKDIHSGLMMIKESVPSADFTSVFMRKLERKKNIIKEQNYFFIIVLSFFSAAVIAILGYAISALSPDYSISADVNKYITDFSGKYEAAAKWYNSFAKGQNLTIVGSVLSLGILISAYFFYDTHKTLKNLLK